SSLDQLLADNPQIRTNQDFINYCYRNGGNTWNGASEVARGYGQDLNKLVQNRSGAIGSGSSQPVTSPPADGTGHVDAPVVNPGTYDGTQPAPGTTNTRAWIPLDAPLQNREGDRSASNYAQVINQFAVGNNPRYTPREGNTYCNIFAWDVTRAMGAEIPHWVKNDGSPAAVGEAGAYELDANGVNRWLNNHGEANGWRQVSAEEAQRLANEGHPCVASWYHSGGIGHISVVRPGELTNKGPAIAQAGSTCTNSTHVWNIFPSGADVQYWVHE
ncbi:MAG: hypothetical protein JXR83_12680, partial [Deltaproteobacteria bacterium]|nr:hypothetical protein [Deltaproteobacteria bacterium]